MSAACGGVPFPFPFHAHASVVGNESKHFKYKISQLLKNIHLNVLNMTWKFCFQLYFQGQDQLTSSCCSRSPSTVHLWQWYGLFLLIQFICKHECYVAKNGEYVGKLNTITKMISKFLLMLLFLLKKKQNKTPTGNEETSLCKVRAASSSVPTGI